MQINKILEEKNKKTKVEWALEFVLGPKQNFKEKQRGGGGGTLKEGSGARNGNGLRHVSGEEAQRFDNFC